MATKIFQNGWMVAAGLLVSGLLILSAILAIAPVHIVEAPDSHPASDNLYSVFGGTVCPIFWWITKKSIHS